MPTPKKKNAFQLERKITKLEQKTAITSRNRELMSFIDEVESNYIPAYKQLNKLIPPKLDPYR
jgi:hypothetical protein